MKTAITVLALGLAAMSHATYTPIDFSGYATYDSSQLTNPSYPVSDYPTTGAGYSIGSVPFIAAKNPNGDTVGEGLIAVGPIFSANSVTVPVGLSGIQSFYTLASSFDGSQNTNIGDIKLNGSSGSVTYQLIEGKNVRDHYFGNFVNTYVSGISATAYWLAGAQVGGGFGYVRNDMQGFIVPGYIGSLNSVTYTYTGGGYIGDGAPLVFGLTVSTDVLKGVNSAAPSPAAILPFLIGGLGTFVRNRRK